MTTTPEAVAPAGLNETGSSGAHLLFGKFHCSTQNVFRIPAP